MKFGKQKRKQEKPPEKEQPKPEEPKEKEDELKADAEAAAVSEPQQEEQKPEEKPEEIKEEEHKSLIRVKLQRSLYFPINGRPCDVSCSKDEIVRVSRSVFEEHEEDIEELEPGPTTREIQEEKAGKGSLKENTISSKDFGGKKE